MVGQGLAAGIDPVVELDLLDIADGDIDVCATFGEQFGGEDDDAGQEGDASELPFFSS